ncbi:MAG TPA: MogA/MoaB family molybdenum cofactor biosynthesis protein [candidate division Zixibacteria bacterium]
MHDSDHLTATARIVTVSTRCASGLAEDRSGPILRDGLVALGIEVHGLDVVPDQRLIIQKSVISHCDVTPVSLLIFTGGTGPTPDDVTPESVLPLLNREYPAIASAISADARTKVPTAPLSRLLVGQRRGTIIIALPGSAGAVIDALETLRPMLPHLLRLAAGEKHGH